MNIENLWAEIDKEQKKKNPNYVSPVGTDSGIDALWKKINKDNKDLKSPIGRTPPGYTRLIEERVDPTVNKPTFLSAAPLDTRKEDTIFTKLGRFALPESLETKFGIDTTQRKPKEMTTAESIAYVEKDKTIGLMQRNPEMVSDIEYLRSGITFGNNVTKYLPGYENDITPTDLPPPTKLSQQIAYGIGNTITIALAQPLIEEAFVSLATKIPGGAGILSKVTEAAKLSPWKIGYPMAFTKAGIEGGLFGLITKNNKSLSENVLETAGGFAFFTAFAYPLAQFFKPILTKVGESTLTPKSSKLVVDDALNAIKTQETTGVMWFENAKDSSEILKVTYNGVQSVEKGLVPAGTNILTLTKVDIQAFKESPSLFNQKIYSKLVKWFEGDKVNITFEPPVTTPKTEVPIKPTRDANVAPVKPTETPTTAGVPTYNQPITNPPTTPNAVAPVGNQTAIRVNDKTTIGDNSFIDGNSKKVDYSVMNNVPGGRSPAAVFKKALQNAGVSPFDVASIMSRVPVIDGQTFDDNVLDAINDHNFAVRDFLALPKVDVKVPPKPTEVKVQPEPKQVTITHFTKDENINSILSEGFDVTRAPIHGVGGLQGGAKTGKAGGDVLYFTTDNARWKTAEVFVGEGNGDISHKAFDYDKQEFITEKNAYKKINLSPLEANVKSDAKILEIGDLNQAMSAIKKSGSRFDKYEMIQQLVDAGKKGGYDIVHISNKEGAVWGDPNDDPTKTGYRTLTGNSGNSDYFVLNKNVLELSKPKTQVEKVKQAVEDGAKSIKEIAEETKILEPNVRRILGVGAKEGIFERVDKGVYTLSKDGIDTAWVETGNALESLPRLAKEGFKADMVFLDIPYNTPAIKGGNRGMKYETISVLDFGKILDSVKVIAVKGNTPVVHMYSQAPSGMAAMQKYNDLFIEKGFKPVGKGELQKTFKDGSPVTNVRGKVSEPEGILVFSQSGKIDKSLGILNFKLVRPKGYQSEKPAEMLKAIIEMTTNEGDIVLDPFAGSGVTGAEAIKAGRKAYLIEKNKDVAETVTKPRVKTALKSLEKDLVGKKFTNEGKEFTVIDTNELSPDEGNQYFATAKGEDGVYGFSAKEIKAGLIEKTGQTINVAPEENIDQINASKPEGNEPFNITPATQDRTPFAITPREPASFEPFIPKESGSSNLELVSEDINQKIQEKADDLMENAYNNDPKFKEQALTEAKKFVKEKVEIEGKAISRPEMIISKTQLKDMLSGLEQDVIEMKVIVRDDKKYLHYKQEKQDILIRPSALGLVEDNIKIGDFVKMDVAKLKPKGTSIRAVDSSGKVMASKGSQPIGKFEQQTTTPEKSVADSFKLFEKVNEMIKKYAERVGEGYLPRGAKGVYYHGTTRNIRLTSMNELSTASHEISHYLDEQFNITNKLMAITGYSKKGNPIYDSATSKERKELTSLYERYYPGAKSTHKLSLRMSEGFATLVQKYVEMPTTITQNYPNLVNSILKPEGEFYNPTIGEMIRDLRQIVEDYQALSPLDQIGAVVTSDKNLTGKESFLNYWQELRTEVADEIYPIEVLAGRAGVKMTVNDPSLWMRMYGLSNSYIINNISGDKGYWRLKGMDLVKTNDSNWKTLLKRLKKEKTFDSFGSYLVARDQHFQFKNLKELKEEADQLKRALKYASEEEKIKLNIMADEAQKAYEELKVVLDKNGIIEATATKAFKENENRFKEETELHDQLVREDVEFAHDDAVGLLSDEKYKKFISTEGYASLKREIYDDILGDAEVTSSIPGGTKVSSFKARTGSSKTIIHPVLNAIRNHAEITKKGLKQVVYNSIGKNIAKKFPDLFQIQQLQTVPDGNTGRFIFPQEKDPNIIMAIINGKKVPILTDKYVKGIVDDVLSYYDMHILEKTLTVMSRIFTKGTTAIYPQFLLSNVSMDTVSAAIQTQTKMIPLMSALKEFYKALTDSKSVEAQLLVKYLVSGGDRQTMVGYQDMSANELVAAVTKEREGVLKVLDLFSKGEDILGIPSKYSEIFTRGTEYIRSVKQGNPHIVALEHAGRVSAPFHHIGRLGGGRAGKTFVKTIPFFNPALQVLDQQVRIFETPEGRQRAYFGMAILAALMAVGAGSIVMYGTEKQKRLYANLDPKEMGMYIYYPNLDGETLEKRRVPEGWSFVGSVIAMGIADKQLNAHYSTVEYLEGATSWIPSQLKPWEFNEWIFSVLPQGIKTPALFATGKKDFPRLMDIESQGQKNKEPALRYSDSTSALAKWMGGEFDMSPLKIDALITGVFGRASGYFTLKPSAYSLKSSLTTSEYFDSGRAMQLYYDTKKENDLKLKSIKNKRREFTPEEKDKVLKLNMALSSIDNLIEIYKNVDEEKNPEKSEKTKQDIYNLINKKLRGD